LSLEGRKLWLVGIGGSGLSAYALVARGWGAEVAGWDRKETPYLVAVREAGIDVTVSDEPPAAPDGFDVVVSTAYAGRVPGKPRAELLAELAAQAPTIVVSGAHGKTTTAAMIAFVLDRLGLDPAFAIGGEVPQLGANARAGSGWFVVEGDESDRTVASLPARIAVITNVDLDHHTTFGSRAEVEELYAGWLAGLPDVQVVRGDALEPVELSLAVPGEHNRRNAAAALAALELAGVPLADAEAAIVEFRGAGRRLEPRGEAGGVQVLDDYAHHPAELAATISAARELTNGRLVVLFQPHLFSRTLYLARDFAEALAAADAVCIADIYAAREEPIPGVTGKLLVDRLCERRPGMPVGWAPTPASAVELIAAQARPGGIVITAGAGDVDAAIPALLEALR
jgi:UDP-N-acetylmuramate--alanine ligase